MYMYVYIILFVVHVGSIKYSGLVAAVHVCMVILACVEKGLQYEAKMLLQDFIIK